MINTDSFPSCLSCFVGEATYEAKSKLRRGSNGELLLSVHVNDN